MNIDLNQLSLEDTKHTVLDLAVPRRGEYYGTGPYAAIRVERVYKDVVAGELILWTFSGRVKSHYAEDLDKWQECLADGCL